MKRQRLVDLAALSFVLLLGNCSFIRSKLPPSRQVQPPRTDADASLQVGNLTRLYDLHVPSSYNQKQPVPLVIAFHGVDGTGKAMEQMTGLSQVAEQGKFIVAYPDAIDGHWSTLRGNKPDTTNDVGFVSALIDKLSQKYAIDRQRIYATGFSNGGMFTHRLGCELSNKISAIAIVAAAMPGALSDTCKPVKPVSVLMMHGAKDPAIPYGPPGKGLLSLTDTVEYWRTHNRCAPQAVQETLPNFSNVRLDRYQQCRDKTDVMLYTIEGGEHSWPISAQTPAGSKKSSQELDASTIIWNFFNTRLVK